MYTFEWTLKDDIYLSLKIGILCIAKLCVHIKRLLQNCRHMQRQLYILHGCISFVHIDHVIVWVRMCLHCNMSVARRERIEMRVCKCYVLCNRRQREYITLSYQDKI